MKWVGLKEDKGRVIKLWQGKYRCENIKCGIFRYVTNTGEYPRLNQVY